MQIIKISKCGHYFVDESDEPFLYFGDTAWELFHRLTREETEYYLQKRKEQGFNVIQAVVLAELHGLKEPNAYGELPLVDYDVTKPNEAYFEHVDWVIKRANEHGLYIGLLPSWGSHVESEKGSHGRESLRVLNSKNAADFGTWLARRYKERGIIWILGGDRMPDTKQKVETWDAMAKAIKDECGDSQLVTYHPSGRMSCSIAWHNNAHFDFNMIQSGHHPDQDHYNMVEADYLLEPPKPSFDGEPAYEFMPHYLKPEYPHFSTRDIRSRAYRGLFSGAAGHTYGCNTVWQMYRAGREGQIGPIAGWKESLDAPAAWQMRYVKKLIESKPQLSRRPDQELIASDTGWGEEHIRACSGEERTYGFVYFPSRKPAAVRLGLFNADTVDAWWYDPRTGDYRDQWTHLASGVREFMPPADGDWVLVIEKV